MKAYSEYHDEGYGFKLYNEEHSMWSWHDTVADASIRLAMEQRIYGRSFQIAPVSAAEWNWYGSRENLDSRQGGT